MVVIAIQAYAADRDGHRDRRRNDSGHYAVVIGYDAERYYLEDPSLAGRRGFLPKAEFLRRWHDAARLCPGAAPRWSAESRHETKEEAYAVAVSAFRRWIAEPEQAALLAAARAELRAARTSPACAAPRGGWRATPTPGWSWSTTEPRRRYRSAYRAAVDRLDHLRFSDASVAELDAEKERMRAELGADTPDWIRQGVEDALSGRNPAW